MSQPAKLPPVGEGGPFQIGGDLWPGLAKLTEEAGELLQVVGKIMAYPEQNDHPDGTVDMRRRLIEEIGDVAACLAFVIDANNLEQEAIGARSDYKVERFVHWHNKIREGTA